MLLSQLRRASNRNQLIRFACWMVCLISATVAISYYAVLMRLILKSLGKAFYMLGL